MLIPVMMFTTWQIFCACFLAVTTWGELKLKTWEDLFFFFLYSLQALAGCLQMMGTTGPCVNYVSTNHSKMSHSFDPWATVEIRQSRDLKKKTKVFLLFCKSFHSPWPLQLQSWSSTKIFDFFDPLYISILLCLQRASAEDSSKIGHERSMHCSWYTEFDTWLMTMSALAGVSKMVRRATAC